MAEGEQRIQKLDAAEEYQMPTPIPTLMKHGQSDCSLIPDPCSLSSRRSDYSLFPTPYSLASQAGVTLLELLVVAALASILLALVFPSIRAGMGTIELRSSAQRLAAAAKFARDQAIFRQRPYELEIDLDSKTVSVSDTQGGTRSFDLPEGVHIGAILPPESEPAPRIRRFLFTPDGSSVPFEIVLENPRRRLAITTDPLTGFPRIADAKPPEL